jgi:hypothetical protein
MKLRNIFVITGVAFVVGCASPHVVDEKQVGDENLSCSELKDQIDDAGRFEKKARDEKGVTGTNVAAAIFFWPAMIVTYENAGDAIDAAKERRRNLGKLYASKGCSGDELKAGSGGSLSKKLMELNGLYKDGIISEEEYNAAKRKELGL